MRFILLKPYQFISGDRNKLFKVTAYLQVKALNAEKDAFYQSKKSDNKKYNIGETSKSIAIF